MGYSMGGHHSKITKQELEAYKQLTFFTEKEILKCLDRFVKLIGDDVIRTVKSINDERCKVSFNHVVNNMEELKVNPFAHRLCETFAQSEEFLIFEEFLDMMSVLSEAAPPQVKAEWAFQVYDYDGDNMLGRGDIAQVVAALTHSVEGLNQEAEDGLDKETVKGVVEKVLDEADFNKTEFISLTEFKQIATKSPSFADNFRIKL